MKCVDCGGEVAVTMYLDALQVGLVSHEGKDYYSRYEPDYTGARCIECGLKLIRQELEETMAEIVAGEVEEAA